MGRYTTELGLTPAARSRVVAYAEAPVDPGRITKIEFVTVYEDAEGKRHKGALSDCRPVEAADYSADQEGSVQRIYLDERL